MSPEELKAYWVDVIDVIPPVIEYRLHYNELGEIVLCSMIDHPDSTSYVVVDKKEYENYFKYRIVKGHLVNIDHDSIYCVRLKKSTTGYPTVTGHAGIVLETNEVYNNIEYYEPNN